MAEGLTPPQAHEQTVFPLYDYDHMGERCPTVQAMQYYPHDVLLEVVERTGYIPHPIPDVDLRQQGLYPVDGGTTLCGVFVEDKHVQTVVLPYVVRIGDSADLCDC